MSDTEQLLQQLDGLLAEFKGLRTSGKYSDMSDHPDEIRQSLVTRAVAAVHRIAGSTSTYAADIEQIRGKDPHLHRHAAHVLGVAQALRQDLAAGFLMTYRELIHADMLGDVLSVAQELLDAKYKDAAAVTAGAALEGHLRNLCRKHGIDVEDQYGKPKRLDRMNSELATAGVFGKLDQKGITAWAGLRNKAAHGDYGEYEAAQVALMLEGVSDFMRRRPA